MNCQDARDRLIDLLYGELDEPLRAGLLAHLDACRDCADEYARLRRGRSALSRLAAGEPAMGPLTLGAGRLGSSSEAASGGRGVRRVARIWGLAAAAAIVLAGLVFLVHDLLVPPAIAQTRPVEIKRVGVSLTILSRPPEWDAHGQFPAGQPGPQQYTRQRKRYQTRPAVQSDEQTNGPYQLTAAMNVTGMNVGGQLGWQVTMPAQFLYLRDWPGLALVRDQRVIRNVRPGRAQVRFTDVPSGIWPDSVRLRCLDDSNALTILEQNYQYDLASADAVLARHVDKAITVRFKDGQRLTGTLLSFDDSALVIRPEGQGPQSITRDELAAVNFERLPEGLLTTPTLLWQLANAAKQTERQFEVAYLTTGLFWRADYVLKLRPAGGSAHAFGVAAKQDAHAFGVAAKPDGESIIDRADLVGYATVVNNSGVSYEDAQLKLMAGDVNLLIRPHRDWYEGGIVSNAGILEIGQPQMVEKSFFEYHLYTLTRPTTLADNETKQLEMVSGRNLALRRGYVYDPQDNPSAARVVSEIENKEENGLGKPLPKGVIRLYAPDPEGIQTYVSQTEIDHTPVKEKLRLPWGHAFDIACSFREADAQHNGPEHRIVNEYSLRNHKDHDVTVTVLVHVPITTYSAECKLPWHVREVGLVEVTAGVPANQETKFTFHHRFNDVSGGGLQAPQTRRQ